MTTDITIALAQAAEYLKASGQTEKALAAGRHSPGFCLPRWRKDLLGVDTAPRSAPFDLL
jgi:hypothetical protein